MDNYEDTSNNRIESETSHTNAKGLKETFKTGSPDEVKEKVKDAVQKGVAAVAGALQGFNEKTKQENLPEQTKSAVHQAGETARGAIGTVTDEVKNLRQPVKDAAHKIGETARDLRSTAKEEFSSTKGAVSGASTPSSFGGSSEDYSSRPGMGMGGSDLGSTSSSTLGSTSTGLGTEMPDISKTPLAQSDKKLQGKDLSSEYEEE